MNSIEKTELLRNLDMGGIVAEHDALLSQSFIPHPVLGDLTHDRKDVVLGAKGAGKSALWKEIKDQQQKYPAVKNVKIHLVTNPAGDPEFREVLLAVNADNFPDADELRVGWRLYFLAQLWRVVRELIVDSAEKRLIEKDIAGYGIIPRKAYGLKAAFAYALAKARALKQLKVEWTSGLSLEFNERELKAGGTAGAIPFNDLTAQINNQLALTKVRVWLVLDRLDEIILGDEEKENVVLKGLLLAYRDMSDYSNARIKVFLRDDVYDRVTSLGHFPALTHIRSKAAGPIRWDLEDLLLLVVRRLAANGALLKLVQHIPEREGTSEGRRKLFYTFFPEKIDRGKAAEGVKWIVDRITDGNGVATPRDLLSVVEAARTIQIEQFRRDGIVLPDLQLFSEDTLRQAVRKVAKDNLETRIYAEYPDLRAPIESFRGNKADHNSESLGELLGEKLQRLLPRLERVGFLFRRNRNGVEMWTVPFFYSFALDITRGAAFDLD